MCVCVCVRVCVCVCECECACNRLGHASRRIRPSPPLPRHPPLMLLPHISWPAAFPASTSSATKREVTFSRCSYAPGRPRISSVCVEHGQRGQRRRLISAHGTLTTNGRRHTSGDRNTGHGNAAVLACVGRGWGSMCQWYSSRSGSALVSGLRVA